MSAGCPGRRAELQHDHRQSTHGACCFLSTATTGERDLALLNSLPGRGVNDLGRFEASQFRWREVRSRLDDLIPNSIPYELAYRVQLKLAHDVRAMCFSGLYADTQGDRDFFSALSFGKQLNNFSLTRGEPAAQQRLWIGRGVGPAE